MDIADVKRQARAAASKRRAEAHELLRDSAGAMMAARGLPPDDGTAPGIVSGFIPYKSEITPIPMLERLNREVNAALAQPDIRQRFQEFGIDARGGSPEELRDLLAGEIVKWKELVETTKMEKQ